MVDGQGDPPLSPLGEWQAEQVGARLADEPIAALYCSSLQRTSQTAAPLAARLGLTPDVDPDLREVHLGIGEGGEFRRMAADGHPSVLLMRETHEWGAIPEAETNQQLRDRTVGAIHRIAERHPDEMVAVFCHGGVIGSLLGHAIGRFDFTMNGSRNGALSHVVVAPVPDGEPMWIVRSFNDAAHTGPLTADAEPPT